MIGPKEVLVALKLAVARVPGTVRSVGSELGISAATVSRAMGRLRDAGLLYSGHKINAMGLNELLSHAARYLYPAVPGEFVLGIPTGSFASPLSGEILGAEPLVMPIPEGPVRGRAVEPICAEAAVAAQKDERMYEVLALVDALRIGSSRERRIASRKLKECLGAASIN